MALILLAVFFFTVFLTVFTALAVLIFARILWAQRQSRRETSENAIEVEYSVVKPEANQHDEGKSVEDRQLEDQRNQERE